MGDKSKKMVWPLPILLYFLQTSKTIVWVMSSAFLFPSLCHSLSLSIFLSLLLYFPINPFPPLSFSLSDNNFNIPYYILRIRKIICSFEGTQLLTGLFR